MMMQQQNAGSGAQNPLAPTAAGASAPGANAQMPQNPFSGLGMGGGFPMMPQINGMPGGMMGTQATGAQQTNQQFMPLMMPMMFPPQGGMPPGFHAKDDDK